MKLKHLREGWETETALALAKKLHANDSYNGQPYFDGHILPVIAMVKKIGGNEIQQTIAALHDVVEDGHITLSELRQYFAAPIINAVDSISRRKSETYFEYVARAKADPVAALVKKADLLINLGNNPPESLKKRYLKALGMLKDSA